MIVTKLLQPSKHCRILSESQIQTLDLPVGSIVLIEVTDPRLTAINPDLGKQYGEIAITDDGYTLKIDSEDEEIPEFIEYLQNLVNGGSWVRFALPDNRSTWWVWQEKPWQYGKNSKGVKALYLSPFDS
jgi:hypothetical protein